MVIECDFVSFVAGKMGPDTSVSNGNQPDASYEPSLCLACRHSVEVRGMDDVVCLAHLTVRHPATAGACKDFEGKNTRGVESACG